MENIEIWWIWMGLAAILIIVEIFHAGFFLLWFSIGAAFAGILAMLKVNEPAQFIVFILVSLILFVSGRRFAERITEKQPPGIGADRYTDQIGIVSEAIDNTTLNGSIKIGKDSWKAVSENGEPIPENSVVKVIRMNGIRAIVKKIEKEEQ
jgi:membrane protein implicated in regulation of membrane protease activity